MTPETQKVSSVYSNVSAGVLYSWRILMRMVSTEEASSSVGRKGLEAVCLHSHHVKDPVIYGSKCNVHEKSSGTFFLKVYPQIF